MSQVFKGPLDRRGAGFISSASKDKHQWEGVSGNGFWLGLRESLFLFFLHLEFSEGHEVSLWAREQFAV